MDSELNAMAEAAAMATNHLTQSSDIGKLAEALSKCQGDLKNAAKSTANPFYKSKYADLAECWDTIRPALSKHGLCVVQTHVGNDPNVVTLQTQLIHSSGQWIRGTLTMKPAKNDPQGIGSATTYARRYGLAAIVGLAQEDDDGNAATHSKASKQSGDEVNPESRIRKVLSKDLGIAKDDIDSQDAVIEWVTGGGYRTLSEALKTRADAESCVQAIIDKWKETGNSFDHWLNEATRVQHGSNMDSEFKEVVG